MNNSHKCGSAYNFVVHTVFGEGEVGLDERVFLKFEDMSFEASFECPPSTFPICWTSDSRNVSRQQMQGGGSMSISSCSPGVLNSGLGPAFCGVLLVVAGSFPADTTLVALVFAGIDCSTFANEPPASNVLRGEALSLRTCSCKASIWLRNASSLVGTCGVASGSGSGSGCCLCAER